jgi:tRNA pseudouridine13 synthase
VRLKHLPEDFRVIERSQIPLGRGPHAIYTLRKRQIGTLEALDRIVAAWNLERHRVSHGGMKDWQAVTEQRISILHGPERSLDDERFELEYIAQSHEAVSPKSLLGNEFTIVARDLDDSEASQLPSRLAALTASGVPNYFDDQRFGSLGESGEFVAAAWCRGDFERALWLALADPNAHDRPSDVREKETLRDAWGDFVRAKAELPRSNRRSLVTFLVDRPGDFRGALARLRRDERSLYVSAFQSHIVNRTLARWIEQHAAADDLDWLTLRLGRVPVALRWPDAVREVWKSLRIPFPATKLHHPRADVLNPMLALLAEYELEPRRLRLKGVDDTFFGKGQRTAALFPTHTSADVGEDTSFPGRQAAELRFSLPPGGYATLVLKCLSNRIDESNAEQGNSESATDESP